MTSAARTLRGLSVLIVEDDYYQAEDARAALEQAGASVLGPCRDGEEAVSAIEGHHADCAVVDINLGGGPSFVAARSLLQRGLPVVFVTGYEQDVIPLDLRHLSCLQKPTDGRRIVAAVAEVCRPGTNWDGST
jgi:DNA-binding response OmpR family regulator